MSTRGFSWAEQAVFGRRWPQMSSVVLLIGSRGSRELCFTPTFVSDFRQILFPIPALCPHLWPPLVGINSSSLFLTQGWPSQLIRSSAQLRCLIRNQFCKGFENLWRERSQKFVSAWGDFSDVSVASSPDTTEQCNHVPKVNYFCRPGEVQVFQGAVLMLNLPRHNKFLA